MARKRNKREIAKIKSGGANGQKTRTKESQDIHVELDVDQNKYDESNPLVLPSKKAAKSEKKVAQNAIKKPKKVLSKKKQKKLQKVLERKKHSQDRSKLLEELKKHQLDDKSYQALVSTSASHTKGFKRDIDALDDIRPSEMESGRIKTSAKTRRIKINTLNEDDNKSNANVIGFDQSEESDNTDDQEEEEEQANNLDVKDNEASNNEKNCQSNSERSDPKETDDNASNESEPASSEGKTAEAVTNTEKKAESQSKENLRSSSKKDGDKSDSKPETYVDMRTRFVPLDRDPKIQESRSKLPIISEEQSIMETIRYNDVTIVCGETGSGKTTQIPQFLYEAGYALEKQIGVTEPRRVAAIAMSRRVGQEMNLSSDIVSYQIRFEGNCSDSTRIKFMTDGILLKEIQKDLLLKKYSVIIIDEAHERTVYSDILIGLLSRIIKLRSKKEDPLKLIIMSATLRIKDFTENPNLFKTKPPVIKIDSRQHPVSIHFNKKTPEDYLHEAYLKVCKIHRKMPKQGGILVFLTGQQEVINLCQKLRRTFPYNPQSTKPVDLKEEQTEQEPVTPKPTKKESKQHHKSKPKTLEDIMPQIDLDSYGLDVDLADDASDLGEALDSSDDDEELINSCNEPLYCLPLFSHLSEKKQQLIFQNPPPGCRLCVIATNIAETSLTIPNIKYVVDTGKAKFKVYDQVTGVSTFIIDWTSKASADQRAGRAGRMGPGHCYRLYSSAVYHDNFKEFSEPEIARKPIEDLVLQMKAMNIDNVLNFPFPTPPPAKLIATAEKKLALLGALDRKKVLGPIQKGPKSNQWLSRITPLGKVMSYFPLSPRYAKMLVLASQHDLISYAVAIVSALTVQEVFLSTASLNHGGEDVGKRLQKDQLLASRKKWAGTGQSLLLGDLMVLLKAIGAWEYVGCTTAFCERYGLRLKAMNEIRKLRHQLQTEISTIFSQLDFPRDLKMELPTDIQAKCLRQVLLSGLFDRVARKIPEEEKNDENRRQLKNAYKSAELEDPVFISTDSMLFDISPGWVAYQEIYETQKLYMRNVLTIEPEWLPIYAPNMCKFSKPIEEQPPRYDSESDCIKCTVHCTFGPHFWTIPDAEVEYPEGIDRYRWFARYLLEGEVFPYFATKKNLLLSSPSIMIKSWAKLQKRTETLLNSLVARKICTRRSLEDVWKEEPSYLLREYCQWIPEAYHMDIERDWPPIQRDP